MEQKGRIGFRRAIGALALGYVAAGITYVFLPIILAYPTGMLRGATGSAAFSTETIRGVSAIAAFAVWILVSVHYFRKWRKKPE